MKTIMLSDVPLLLGRAEREERQRQAERDASRERWADRRARFADAGQRALDALFRFVLLPLVIAALGFVVFSLLSR